MPDIFADMKRKRLMEFLIDTFFLGLGVAGTFLTSKVLKFRHKEIYESGVYAFQTHTSRTCPKCNMTWFRKGGYDYCECEEYHSGHFHVQCRGKVEDIESAGCGFKYIMRTK